MGSILWQPGLWSGKVIDDSDVAGANSLTGLAPGSAALTGTTNFNGSPGGPPSSIDNAALKGFQLSLMFNLLFASAPTADKTFDIYILYLLNSVYGGGTSGASPTIVQRHWLDSIALVNNVTQPPAFSTRRILPYKFQLQFVNGGDTALAAQSAGSWIFADVAADSY